jgi:branched-chain amino acid transport system ATP-binding protein
MSILEAQGVKKAFGGVIAVGGVDLDVREGEMYGVIGPNGAGKSTLFNVISGFNPCDRGTVRFKGRDITRLPPHRIVKMGMGRSFQVTKVFPRLTVYENVHAAVLFSQGYGYSLFRRATSRGDEAARNALAMADLSEKTDEIAGALSAGDRKRLELAIVLAASPEILLLDEPTCGMSPQETAETIDLIKRINRETGITVLFTEHKMDFVFSMASRITVMHFGRVIAAGAPDEVRNDAKVREVYLGEA